MIDRLKSFVWLINGIIIGCMLMMYFLQDRVDSTLNKDFNNWTAYLLAALVTLYGAEWLAIRMLKRSNG